MVLNAALIFWLALQAPQPETLYRSALASLQAKQYDQAEASFRELYRLEPQNLRGLAGIAQVYVAQSRTADALDLLGAEATAHPERADIHILLGDTAERAGQNDVALAEFQNALRLLEVLSKETAAVYLRIGNVYRNKGDAKSALDALRRAADIAPGDAAILASLAVELDASGDKLGAAAQYRTALAANPRNPIVENNLAFLITQTGGDLYEALRLARDAKSRAPQVIEISDTIGWVSLQLGWVDEAIDTLSNVVWTQPGNKSFRAHLIAAIDKKRDQPATLTNLRKALEAEPTAANQEAIRGLLAKPTVR